MSWFGFGGGVKLHDDYGKQVSDGEAINRLAAANTPDLYNGSTADKELALQAASERLNSRPPALPSDGQKAGPAVFIRGKAPNAAALGAETGAAAGATAATLGAEAGATAGAETAGTGSGFLKGFAGSLSNNQMIDLIGSLARQKKQTANGGEEGEAKSEGGIADLGKSLGSLLGQQASPSGGGGYVQPNVQATPQSVSFDWQRRNPFAPTSGRK